MDKEENNYSAFMPPPSNFNNNNNNLQDYTLDHHLPRADEISGHDHNSNGIVNYLISNNQHQQMGTQLAPEGFCGASTSTTTTSSFDKLSFADVMQFADFGPKLALNQQAKNNNNIHDQEPSAGIDPVYFLKFPVLLNDKLDNVDQSMSLMVPQGEDQGKTIKSMEGEDGHHQDEELGCLSGSNNNSLQQLQFLGEDRGGGVQQPAEPVAKNKRKRPRTTKTTQEVESQRMTHIAVERNRRKQMNEHLRVLRSLMPGSYVQRGDQASIIGGAIEFVRELEQLLQCLESQKRRRLLGDGPTPRQVVGGDPSAAAGGQGSGGGCGAEPVFHFPAAPNNLAVNNSPDDAIRFVDNFETGLREETAESKSCFADVEVKILGFDAMIKILSQRRPGQLIKAIAALEDLQLNILHTNITTIEQTVLYSFNVKVGNESRFTAEDIATSVQQIFSFIHANNVANTM